MTRKLMMLLLSGLICLLGTVSVLAQTRYNSLSDYEKATGKKIEKFNEAPVLGVKVDAGELPPVEERLPEDPIIVEPIEEIGQYGGVLNVQTTEIKMWGVTARLVIGDQSMLTFGPDLNSGAPNLVKEWTFSEEGKVITLYLRKGIKWSDGVPFTADDVICFWEDIVLDDEIYPVKPSSYVIGDQLMEMRKIDGYTVSLHFAKPYPLVTGRLSHWWGTEGNFYVPKHYIKQFLPRYTPKEELEKLAKEEGYTSWSALARTKVDDLRPSSSPPDMNLPTLRSFVLTESKLGLRRFKRNPYFFKVDTAGNQLPYIDEIRLHLVENAEVGIMRDISGEMDIDLDFVTVPDFPLFKENAEKGGYRVIKYSTSMSGGTMIKFNMTHPYLVLREIFGNVKFRIALSLAIDREEINQVIYFGMAGPYVQAEVLPESRFYEPEVATLYTEHDPKKANQLLDGIGLDKLDKEGYRLRPDGKRFTIVCEYYPFGEETSILELVKDYWKEVGIRLILEPQERTFNYTRTSTNQVDMFGWGGIGGASDLMFMMSPVCHVPVGWWPFAGWNMWYTSKGEKGVEPPVVLKYLVELRERLQSTIDEEERTRLGREIIRIGIENLWVINPTGYVPRIVIAKNNLRNLPREGSGIDNDWNWGVPYCPPQFFLKR